MIFVTVCYLVRYLAITEGGLKPTTIRHRGKQWFGMPNILNIILPNADPSRRRPWQIVKLKTTSCQEATTARLVLMMVMSNKFEIKQNCDNCEKTLAGRRQEQCENQGKRKNAKKTIGLPVQIRNHSARRSTYRSKMKCCGARQKFDNEQWPEAGKHQIDGQKRMKRIN